MRLCYVKSGITLEKRSPQLIVSFTSFSTRVAGTAPYAAATLLTQSLKPDRVLLWLDEECWNDKNLPPRIRWMRKKGLDVCYCKDVKSYKKLIPALKAYPEDILVTADDDILYSQNWLKELYDSYLNNPSVIHAHRVHKIRLGPGGEILPYNNWLWNYKGTGSSNLIFPTGCAGVLYPPGTFDHEVFNVDAFMTLAPDADDIWFWAMSQRKPVACRNMDESTFKLRPVRPNMGDLYPVLSKKNIGQCQNDIQLRKVLSTYGLDGLKD